MNLIFLRRLGAGNQSSPGGDDLPAGYSRIPYVSCSGSYIDTGVYGSSSTRVVLQFMCTQRSSSASGIIGAYEQDNDAASFIVKCGSGGSGTPEDDIIQFFTYTTPKFKWLNFSDVTVDVSNTGMHSVEEPGPLHDYEITKDLSWNVSSGRTLKTMYLGAVNGSIGLRLANTHNGRIYFCDIYDNDVLVRRYVPARNDTTLECGLYDTVNGTFSVSIANPFQYNVFSGTATESFSVKRYSYNANMGSYVEYGSVSSVEVTNGSFSVELPTLDPGVKYKFTNNTAITSITQAPLIQAPEAIYNITYTQITGWTPCPIDNTFAGCSNLVSICPLPTGGSKVLTSMFEGCSSLVNAPYIYTDGVKFMDRMYYGCVSLEHVPSYDYHAILITESTTTSSLSSMFGLCESLETIDGMTGLQRDVNFRGCVNLSVQSLLNLANTVSTNTRSTWSAYTPEVPPTINGNDTPGDYLNIRVSGTAGSTASGDGSVRVRMYNDDSSKYTEAVNALASKGWIVNN